MQNFKKYIPIDKDKGNIVQRSELYFEFMNKRRTIREFSNESIPKEVIENIIKTASTAPSGANKQPWTFCAVSNTVVKKKIRIAAEKEEYKSYTERMGEEWKADLGKFSTNWKKPFLEIAPWLIIVFKKPYDIVDGERKKNYYVNESVGLASGILISAIHNAGLVTVTHTPSPMKFLEEILERPKNEKAFLLLPLGYPAKNTEVPNLERKDLENISKFY